MPASAAYYRDRLGFETQAPTAQPWGGTDMLVRDPDGTVISFVTYG